jgi:MFS family permease
MVRPLPNQAPCGMACEMTYSQQGLDSNDFACHIKGRWQVSAVLFMTLFVAYLDRMNISRALPLMTRDLSWSPQETERNSELLFSLFHVGYGLANIFPSPLAARIGARTRLAIIIILWSFFTALGVMVAQVLLLLAETRAMLGLKEGVHFPIMNTITRAWFSPSERGRVSSRRIAGLYLAVLLSTAIRVPLLERFGWETGLTSSKRSPATS